MFNNSNWSNAAESFFDGIDDEYEFNINTDDLNSDFNFENGFPNSFDEMIQTPPNPPKIFDESLQIPPINPNIFNETIQKSPIDPGIFDESKKKLPMEQNNSDEPNKVKINKKLKSGKYKESHKLVRYSNYNRDFKQCSIFKMLGSPKQCVVNEIGKEYNIYYKSLIKLKVLPKFLRDYNRKLSLSIGFFEDNIKFVIPFLQNKGYI